ncbi:hypothetical protein HAX54_022463, partial [Datura stramonium]|nr:hypothetical protein [Datura stramonium]
MATNRWLRPEVRSGYQELLLLLRQSSLSEPVSKTAASDLTAFMLLHPMNRES